MQLYSITNPVAAEAPAPATSKKLEVLQALKELENALTEFRNIVPEPTWLDRLTRKGAMRAQLFEQMKVCLDMMIGGSAEVRETIFTALEDR